MSPQPPSPPNALSEERLAALVESIQQLNPTEYEEMFKLLYQNKCEYTRNNNGIFLNLSWLDVSLLEKLELFVEFCRASRREIQHYESICKNLSLNIHDKHSHLHSHLKPVVAASTSMTIPEADDSTIRKPYISPTVLFRNTSAMKFYLLKKKYAKHAVFDQSLQNDLGKERVLL